MNYMNVLSDFEIRLSRLNPATPEQNELARLDSLLKEKIRVIDQQVIEIDKLRKKSIKKKKLEEVKEEPSASKPAGAAASKTDKSSPEKKKKTGDTVLRN